MLRRANEELSDEDLARRIALAVRLKRRYGAAVNVAGLIDAAAARERREELMDARAEVAENGMVAGEDSPAASTPPPARSAKRGRKSRAKPKTPAPRVWRCACGREIRGNAGFARHRSLCPVAIKDAPKKTTPAGRAARTRNAAPAPVASPEAALATCRRALEPLAGGARRGAHAPAREPHLRTLGDRLARIK